MSSGLRTELVLTDRDAVRAGEDTREGENASGLAVLDVAARLNARAAASILGNGASAATGAGTRVADWPAVAGSSDDRGGHEGNNDGDLGEHFDGVLDLGLQMNVLSWIKREGRLDINLK